MNVPHHLVMQMLSAPTPSEAIYAPVTQDSRAMVQSAKILLTVHQSTRAPMQYVSMYLEATTALVIQERSQHLILMFAKVCVVEIFY